MSGTRIFVSLFTMKQSKHLSLGRSFRQVIVQQGGEMDFDILERYEEFFQALRVQFQGRVLTKRILVDKVKGVRERYRLDVIPALLVEESSEQGGKELREIKRFSGKVDQKTVFAFLEETLRQGRSLE